MAARTISEYMLDELYAAYNGDELVGIKTVRQWVDEDGLTLEKIAEHSCDSYRDRYGGFKNSTVFVRIGHIA